MSYKNIVLKMVDHVAVITLNQPDRLNACSLDMADEINDALDNIDGARAVLINSAGRAFCSGADLQAKSERSIAGGKGSQYALMNHYNPLMMKLARLDVPVVTAVNGPAAGIGCSIALAGDFVIAGKSGYFLQAFVNIGLVPDGGATWTLARLVGKARATELMMLGEKLSAEKAESWGLIHKCVADDALADEAMALAKRLSAMPTVALGIMRRNINEALQCDFQTALQREAEGQRVAADSDDAKIGAMAFLMKQKPQFTGK